MIERQFCTCVFTDSSSERQRKETSKILADIRLRDSKIQHLVNLILISKNRSIFIIVTRIHDNTIRKEGGIFIKFIRHFWSPAMRPFTYFLENTLYVTLLKVVIVCRMYLTCRWKFNL